MREKYSILDNVLHNDKRVKIFKKKLYLVILKDLHSEQVAIDGKTLIKFASKYPDSLIEVIGVVELDDNCKWNRTN